MTPHATGPGFFEDIKRYVGFTEGSTAALRELRPLAAPEFPRIVDDFYAAILGHAAARGAITGGDAQIGRLKQTLTHWLDTMLLGPHDGAYLESRARIGRVHVLIDLPQAYMFTAMSRIRMGLMEVVQRHMAARPADLARVGDALHQILDLELAIMLETYREDLLARNSAAERLATVGQFAASIGRKLRNPLGVIESSLVLLRQHIGPASAAPGVAKHLDRIGGEVGRSLKTIDDLLDLSREVPPSRTRSLVRPVVEAAVAASSLPPGVSVELSIPPDLVGDFDPDGIRHVIVNLLLNASQAMRDSGRVRVEGEAAGGGIRLRVRDEGPGVPAEVRHRVFEPLFTTKARGSGLGLALCRRIVEAHGGGIEIEETPGGASFAFWIPAARSEAVPDAAG
jgi:signal transduction histidine kinase